MNATEIQSESATGEKGQETIATLFINEVACLLHAYKDDDGKVHFKPECPTKADEHQLGEILRQLYPKDDEVIIEKAEIELEGVKCETELCRTYERFLKDKHDKQDGGA